MGKRERDVIIPANGVSVNRVRDAGYSNTSYQQRYHHLFGIPLVVTVPRQCAYSDLYQAVVDKGK